MTWTSYENLLNISQKPTSSDKMFNFDEDSIIVLISMFLLFYALSIGAMMVKQVCREIDDEKSYFENQQLVSGHDKFDECFRLHNIIRTESSASEAVSVV
ncbi:hypothetical protein HDE_12697 [Halotydeus destructor]|nr:hypothetical protein HDE_12697 [Halotydeus destructor]